MAKTPEGKVKDKVKALLASYGPALRAWWPVPGGYGESTVDCHVVYCGRAFAIEVKQEGGNTTALQRKFLKDHARAGGVSIVIEGAENPKDEPRNLARLRYELDTAALNVTPDQEVHW